MMENNTSSSFVAFVSGGVSLMFGLLILLRDWNISSLAAFSVGMILLLIGVLFVNVIGTSSLLVILVGFYFFGRAAGVIDHQYLRYGVGIPLTLLGFFILLRELADIFSNHKGR
jgi:hypothetical protein